MEKDFETIASQLNARTSSEWEWDADGVHAVGNPEGDDFSISFDFDTGQFRVAVTGHVEHFDEVIEVIEHCQEWLAMNETV